MVDSNIIHLQKNDEKTPNDLNNQWIISIRDFIIVCSIGILDHEKQAKQPVKISVKCYANIDQSENSDFQYICYDNLIQKIEAFMGKGHIDLIEFAAQGICDLCFAFEQIHRVFVSIEKTNIYSNVASVGIEIDRTRKTSSY